MTVEGEGLARAASNALSFIPARARDQFIRIALHSDRIEFDGTDGYAAGHDNAPAHNGPGHVVAISIARESLAELESFARAWKKLPLSLSLEPGALSLSVEGQAIELPWAAPQVVAWERIDSLFELSEREAGPYLGPVAFDPALLSRFAKVKSSTDRVADFLFRGPELPVLVKVGPTFRGLVMPVYREPARAYTPEGLW